MKKVLKTISSILFVLTISVVLYHYYKQDELIFKTKITPKEHVFQSERPFEELYLQTPDGTSINALHFKTEAARGVFYYLHGAGSNIDRSLQKAPYYLDQGYDVFMIDYRGFGKSDASPFSEAGFFQDVQAGYDYVKTLYPEETIVVCGHSLGSSFATWVAANNNPRLLILEAPFYSMLAAAQYTKPFLPEWILKMMLKYHLRTDQWIVNVKAPIYIFHGTDDRIVPYKHAERLVNRLQKIQGKVVELFTIPGWGHGDLHKHSSYQKFIHELVETSFPSTVSIKKPETLSFESQENAS